MIDEFKQLLFKLPTLGQCSSCKKHIDPRETAHCPMKVSVGSGTQVGIMVLCEECGQVTLGDLAKFGIKVSLEEIERVDVRFGERGDFDIDGIVDGGDIEFRVQFEGGGAEEDR